MKIQKNSVTCLFLHNFCILGVLEHAVGVVPHDLFGPIDVHLDFLDTIVTEKGKTHVKKS